MTFVAIPRQERFDAIIDGQTITANGDIAE